MGERYFYLQLAGFDADNFANVGKRVTGSKAGHYALIGPNWKGKLPQGVKALPRAHTNTIFILGRTLIKNDADAIAVNKLQDQYKLTPLSYWGKTNSKLPESHDVWKPFDLKTDSLAEYKTMNRAMAEFGVDPRYKNYLEMFVPIGVGPGLDVEKMKQAASEQAFEFDISKIIPVYEKLYSRFCRMQVS